MYYFHMRYVGIDFYGARRFSDKNKVKNTLDKSQKRCYYKLKAQKQDTLRVKPSAREKGVWWKPLR